MCNFVGHLLWGRGVAKFNDVSSKCRLSLHVFSGVSSEHTGRACILPQLNLPFGLSEIPNVNVKSGIKKGKKKPAYKNVSVWWSSTDHSKDRCWRIGSPTRCANETLISAINFRKDCGNKFRVLVGSVVCQRSLIFSKGCVCVCPHTRHKKPWLG